MKWLKQYRETLDAAQREAKSLGNQSDRLCANLQAIGVKARLALKGRPEEKWSRLPGHYQPVCIIDIEQSPIRWIKLSVTTDIELGPDWILEFGIPDSRELPKIGDNVRTSLQVATGWAGCLVRVW